LNNYRDERAGALFNVIIPSALLCDSTDNCSTDITGAIDNYYNDVIQCVHFATNGSIPVKAYKNGAYNIPGWNDVVSDKHEIAREAFLDWIYLGKPRQGAEFIHIDI